MARRDELRRVEQALTRTARLSMGRGAARLRSNRSGIDLSRPAIRILAELRDAGPVRPTLLARLCDLEAPVISRELRGLEAADLVRRFADPTDGRASLIEIMPDGRATSLRYRAAVDEIIDETFAAWTAADLKALAVYLERVVVDFSKPRAPQGRGATPERKS